MTIKLQVTDKSVSRLVTGEIHFVCCARKRIRRSVRRAVSQGSSLGQDLAAFQFATGLQCETRTLLLGHLQLDKEPRGREKEGERELEQFDKEAMCLRGGRWLWGCAYKRQDTLESICTSGKCYRDTHIGLSAHANISVISVDKFTTNLHVSPRDLTMKFHYDNFRPPTFKIRL